MPLLRIVDTLIPWNMVKYVAMKPIAIDTHDFPSLRRDGKIYVDKTMYVHRLVTNPNAKLFFLSRPRRFGKSLTVSTLKALFQARRELFEGLAIEKENWSWEKYPIIHLEMNDLSTTSIEDFTVDLENHLKDRLSAAGYEYDDTYPAHWNFGTAIEKLSAASGGKGVAILIDEYDSPVGHCLDDVAKAEAVRDRLSTVYSQMKNRTGDIRFLFMTGVSKFTKMSVFSCLNNIVDITMDEEYATMFGYTEEELEANFEEHLRAHAEKMGKAYEDYRAEMKRWYNGFRFAKFSTKTVYNPISVALCLSRKEPEFSATWSSTGRPSSLMNCLKRWDMLAIDPDRTKRVSERAFDVTNLADLKPIGMLFQTGYLTVKDYSAGFYALGVPDDEVRQDLNLLLGGLAADKDSSWAAEMGARLVFHEWEDFFLGLKSLYASMAYGPTEGRIHENSYARCLSFLLAGSGFRYTMEDVQANGRADIVASHVNGVFIFELKVGEPVDKAFKQIREKGYAEPYLASGQPIYLIGLSFDPETRHLVDAAAECY